LCHEIYQHVCLPSERWQRRQAAVRACGVCGVCADGGVCALAVCAALPPRTHTARPPSAALARLMILSHSSLLRLLRAQCGHNPFFRSYLTHSPRPCEGRGWAEGGAPAVRVPVRVPPRPAPLSPRADLHLVPSSLSSLAACCTAASPPSLQSSSFRCVPTPRPTPHAPRPTHAAPLAALPRAAANDVAYSRNLAESTAARRLRGLAGTPAATVGGVLHLTPAAGEPAP
jgi:hypothetical protein